MSSLRVARAHVSCSHRRGCLTLAAVFVFLLGCGDGAGRKGDSQTPAAIPLPLGTSIIDFGTLVRGGPHSVRVLTVRNPLPESVQVSVESSACKCLASSPSITLAGGSVGELPLSATAQGAIGKRNFSLRIRFIGETAQDDQSVRARLEILDPIQVDASPIVLIPAPGGEGSADTRWIGKATLRSANGLPLRVIAAGSTSRFLQVETMPIDGGKAEIHLSCFGAELRRRRVLDAVVEARIGEQSATRRIQVRVAEGHRTARHDVQHTLFLGHSARSSVTARSRALPRGTRLTGVYPTQELRNLVSLHADLHVSVDGVPRIEVRATRLTESATAVRGWVQLVGPDSLEFRVELRGRFLSAGGESK